MIKFDTKLGALHLNAEARSQKELFQPLVKGMHCSKCKGIDTIISFKENDYGMLLPVIRACCSDFKERVRRKIYEEK